MLAKVEPAVRRALSALPAEAVMLTYLGPSLLGSATLALLGEHDYGKRFYLNSPKELLPGWREVTFARADVVRTVVSVNPSMLEPVTLLRGSPDTYSFECVVQQGGKLQPLRPPPLLARAWKGLLRCCK